MVSSYLVPTTTKVKSFVCSCPKMSETRKVRCTAVQKRKLIEYMASHPLFANGEFSGPLGSQRHESEWQSLAAMLREFGPDKSVAAWKVSWRDLKRKARGDNAAFRRAIVTTGNNSEIPPVGESELMVLSVIGTDSSTGVGPPESAVGDILINDVDVPHSFSPPRGSTSSPPPAPANYLPSRPRLQPRLRNRTRPARLSRFEEMQVENNNHLKTIIDELQKMNELKLEQNCILREQNRILARNQLDDTQIIQEP